MEKNPIKNTSYSIADFYDIENEDIMGRADLFYEKFIKNIVLNKHFQYERKSYSRSGPVRKVEDPYTGKISEMIYFASNDYLNLTNHHRVIKAGKKALLKYGTGSGSVPLLGGTTDLHKKLEDRIAEYKNCESAIIYTSGYSCNSSSLLALLNKKDLAIVDRLAHASLIDGCHNTNLVVFAHNCVDSLENILKNKADKYRTKLIIVDGVYSMDGDIAHLDKILKITKHYGGYLMVDEAHASGVLGKNGRGTPEYFNLSGTIDIVSGTFSKALGGVGGFIASNKKMVSLLKFYSRGYLFSTAMNPQVAGSLIEAIDVIEQEPKIRENLWRNIKYFKKSIINLGYDIGNTQTAIFPLIIGDDYKTKEMCRELHEMNIYANPVLYPAVHKKSSRIRISLMSSHSINHLNKALEILEYVGKKYRVI